MLCWGYSLRMTGYTIGKWHDAFEKERLPGIIEHLNQLRETMETLDLREEQYEEIRKESVHVSMKKMVAFMQHEMSRVFPSISLWWSSSSSSPGYDYVFVGVCVDGKTLSECGQRCDEQQLHGAIKWLHLGESIVKMGPTLHAGIN